ncbi:MAG: transglutaminase domain-containing protein [Clostridiales bacterium]|nr:transglutaminase domain-containing protein [Clostridiales bacterium]
MNDRYFDFFGFVMVYAVLLVISESLLFKYSYQFVLISTIAVYMIVLVAMKFSKIFKIVIGISIAIYCILFLTFFDLVTFNVYLSEILKKLYVFLKADSLLRFIKDTHLFYTGELDEVPELLGKEVYIVSAMAVTYLLVKLMKKSKIKSLVIIPTLFIMAQWIRYVDISLAAFKWYLIGLTGFLIYSILKRNINYQNKYQNRNHFIYSVVAAVVILAITNIVAAVFPLTQINEQLSAFMPAFTSLRSGYTDVSENYYFNLASTMYQPQRNKLGGRIVSRNYDVMMLVESDVGGQYLRGAVKDYYTGNYWLKTDDEYVNRISWLIRNQEAESMSVYYEALDSGVIFVPLNVSYINLNINKVFMNRDEVFYYHRDPFERKMKYYEIEFMTEAIMREREIDLNRYLQLPENLSERLIDLAKSLGADESNAIDKANNIKQYLISNSSYTLLVDDVPENKEFVDYFIFEAKEGYCTYFATAMAIMLRINEIPSRYVEGFISSLEKNDADYYEVTGDRAHAWVEAYINDEWQTIEATPYYVDEAEYDYNFDIIKYEDKGGGKEERETDDERLEPTVVEVEAVKRKPAAIIVMSSIASLLIMCIFLYRIKYKRDVERMTFLDKFQLFQKIAEKEDNIVENIPEKIISEFLRIKLGYEMSIEVMSIIQKMFYSSLSIDDDEKSYIIKEIEIIEKLIKNKIGNFKFFNYRKNFFKEKL